MPRKEDVSVGLNYPIERSEDGYFDKTFTSLEELRVNVINALATRKGERLMKPDFGSNLHEIIFEQATPDLESAIENEIESVINTWVPQVNILDLQVNRVEEEDAVLIDLTFDTPFLPEGSDESIELFFST